MGIGTLWRTVRHLKPQQLVGRVRFRLLRPTADLAPAPPGRARVGAWMEPAHRTASLIGAARLRVLNMVCDLDTGGWEDASLDRLRCYNLHYFDDLNAADADSRGTAHRALIDRWIAENLAGAGTGWEPYPTSLRIVNWIKWLIGGAEPLTPWLDSLAVQARWLSARLEVHLLGNHLFANAKALVFAGLFFEGKEANGWFEDGCAILQRELDEQVLADGGHFERSPMYHALAVEDVLDLINLTAAFGFQSHPLSRALRDRAGSMLTFLRSLSHPDASLAGFNDCAQNVAPPLAELERYADLLGITAPRPIAEGVTHFAASGYVRATRAAATLLIDVAPVGPDYLPGHAHADTLSFELSLRTRRVIVNGGTSCYGVSGRRAYERSTAAHSTVELAGANSSEVWSSFRVGRRARPFDLVVNDSQVACSHDGYRYLPDRPVHRRTWCLEQFGLTVEDQVIPPRTEAIARYPFAPGLRLLATGEARWQVLEGDSVIAEVEVEAGLGSVVAHDHAPEFGRVLAAEALAVTLVDGRARVRLRWDGDAHPVSH